MAYHKSLEYQTKLDDIAKKVCEEIIEWAKLHNGNMPRTSIYKKGRSLNIDEMTEEEKEEVRLARKFKDNKKAQRLYSYINMPTEKVPDKYKELVNNLKNHINLKKAVYEELVEWLQEHNGKMPNNVIRRNGKNLTVEEMTREEQYEVNLRQKWNRSKERQAFQDYYETPIENIPEWYKGMIKTLKSYGVEKTVYEEILEWLEAHEGKMPRSDIKRNGKILSREEITDEEARERSLYQKWKGREAYIFKKYRYASIEEIPKEFREKVCRIRELRNLGKSADEEIKSRMRQSVGRHIEKNNETRESLIKKQERLYGTRDEQL